MVGIGTTSNPLDGERSFWPRRKWWLALLVILVLAGALRYPGYDFGLPFVEHLGVRADEAFYVLAARMNLDMGTAITMDAHHYPPGILSLNYFMLRLFQDSRSPPTVVLGSLRLIAISISLATITILALLGYHLGGTPAGLVSAAFWAVTPTIVEFSRYATADIYVTCFTLLAFWLTLTGAIYERTSWTTMGTYTLMLAVIFKYQAVLIAPLLLAAPLIQGWRSAGRIALGNLARFALFSAWLLLLTPVLDAFLEPEAAIAPNSWIIRLDIDSTAGLGQFSAGIQSVLAELDLRPLLPGWLGLLWLIKGRFGKQHLTLLFVILSVIAWNSGLSLFQEHYIRFLLAPVSMMIFLAGMGYMLWWQFLQQRIIHFTLGQRRLVLGAALFALVALNLPNMWTALQETRAFTLPDQRNVLAHWADKNLPSSRYISNYDNRRTLDRDWGGYAGETRFEYAGNPFADTSIAEWRAQGVLFAIIPHFQYKLWREGGVHEFVTETTLLKSYPPSDAFRGPAMVVLLLHPIQHEATGQLGPIRLIGFELGEDGAAATAGESFSFHLYWQATAPTATDYQVFNHLLDAEGNLVAQIDGPPLPDPLLRRGSKDWDDPEEIIYSRQYTLNLPEELAPGEYTLVTGFYRRDNGQRLLTPTGQDSLWVTSISVE